MYEVIFGFITGVAITGIVIKLFFNQDNTKIEFINNSMPDKMIKETADEIAIWQNKYEAIKKANYEIVIERNELKKKLEKYKNPVYVAVDFDKQFADAMKRYKANKHLQT
jgi:hypothetical protein